jgi:hypothetical protein
MSAPPAGLDLAANHAIDPYLVWAELTEFAGFVMPAGKSDPAIPVLLELAAPAQPGSRVERCINANPLNDPQSAFVTSAVRRSDLRELCAAVAEGALARFQLGLARGEHDPELQTRPRSALAGEPDDDGDVLQTIGIIDDGCCIAHESCRIGADSRFLHVWDQDARAKPGGPWTADRESIGYGVELCDDDIEPLLARHPIGERGERALYADLGRADWGAESRRHGAGVVQIVAQTTAAPLIFVQLPDETVADSSGGSLGVFLLDGVRYIVEKSAAAARRRGVHWSTTINVSLGSIAGPHDGTTITECALAEIASRGNVRIVLAAGNTAGRRIHAFRRIAPNASGRFDVLAPPDNPREAFVELWIPAEDDSGAPLDGAKIRIEVLAPGGARSAPFGVGQAVVVDGGDGVRAAAIFARRVAQGRNGTMVLLAIRPTRSYGEGAHAPARYGIWSVIVSSAAPASFGVHAWVERNDLIVGRRRPQQARFVDDPADPYVDDAFTLSSIANGSNVIVVGGYRLDDETLAAYSANGPTRGERRGPDYLGPSDESAALPGIALPGFFSGWTTRMSGTSVATPHVVRWLVEGAPARKRFKITVAPPRRGAAEPPSPREPQTAPRTFTAIRP